MTVVILYFAALRELLARSEEELTLPAGPITIDELAARLAERHPGLAPHLASVRFAINESFVSGGAQVAPGDRVALLPPVSGG